MAIFNPDFPTWQDAFENAANQIGIYSFPKEIIPDGEIHRFSANGKPRNDSGWYCVFDDDLIGGAIGNWGTGEKTTFCWSSTRITETQKTNLAEKWAEARSKADKIREIEKIEASKEAQTKWASMKPSDDSHPYLIKKGIKSHGIKVGKQRLYVPMIDETGNITSLQSIDDNGQKLFMPKGRVKGCYFIIGEPSDDMLLAEGYATGATLYEATKKPVVISFNAGNILPVIDSIKARFPKSALTICADNDPTGIKHAQEAADKYCLKIITPLFSEEDTKTGKQTDFNDLHHLHGIEAVRNYFLEKEETTKPNNKFNLLTYEDLIHASRIEWVVNGIFPKKSFCVIYGEPAKGKTFVALDMALHIAHGIEWHGHEVVQGSVLYIAGEGVGGLPKRLKAWTYQNGKNLSRPPFYAIAANVNMRDGEDVANIIGAIQSIGNQFSVIFIDTVARAILGGDENSSTDMGLFVASCDKIKDATGATVIGIHHSGKDSEKGMRGSSALLGAVDAVIQVSQETQGHIILKNEKQKDGEPFKDKHFETTIITTGIMDTSLVINPMSEENIPVPVSRGKQDMALQFLFDCIAIDTQTVRGLPATKLTAWRDECYRRELGGDTPDAKKKSFQRAKKRLQESGQIACENGIVWSCKDGV